MPVNYKTRNICLYPISLTCRAGEEALFAHLMLQVEIKALKNGIYCQVHFNEEVHLKSVNLQYITLGCLDDGTNESSIKSLMFQVLFFLILFIDLGHSKLFILIFVIL